MTSLGDARRYAARPLRTVHTAHGPYLDFATVQHDVRRLSVASYANTPPTSAAAVPYFGLMRMPLERLASHYDYIHWGPRSKWATLWKGQDTSALPFASCAARLAAASADTTPRTREAAAGCELARFANVQVLTKFAARESRVHTQLYGARPSVPATACLLLRRRACGGMRRRRTGFARARQGQHRQRLCDGAWGVSRACGVGRRASPDRALTTRGLA